MKSTPIEQWKPARCYPDTYPGECPQHAYIILNNQVHPLDLPEPGDLTRAYVLRNGAREPLDPLLAGRGLSGLADRHPSLAYGANRNPGTLAIKMHNYGYQGRKDGLVLPVLKGTVRGGDVVACGLSGQGYLYADLIPSTEVDADTEVEAWLPLLDADQLRVMHDGENVRSGMYSVAQFPGFRLDGFDRPFSVLGYAGNDGAFISPLHESPIAYSTVRIQNRIYPEMTPVAMMDHVLTIGGLREKIAESAGLAVDSTLALKLMHFMNERWWMRFRGEDQPDARYDDVLTDVEAVIRAHRSPRSTADVMKERGQLLTAEEAYDPGTERTLGALLRDNRT